MSDSKKLKIAGIIFAVVMLVFGILRLLENYDIISTKNVVDYMFFIYLAALIIFNFITIPKMNSKNRQDDSKVDKNHNQTDVQNDDSKDNE